MQEHLVTKTVTINGENYTIRPPPIERNIEILRLTVLHGLVKAPFTINKATVEALPLELLSKLGNEIGALTQEIASAALERTKTHPAKEAYR